MLELADRLFSQMVKIIAMDDVGGNGERGCSGLSDLQ
jgi:hypothetical protein